MSSDWDESDSDTPAKAPPIQKVAKKSKWEGEDDDDDGPASDWEASSDDEPKATAPATTTAAPPKKKGTLKAKLAQKEAERQAKIDAGEDDEYDSDSVLDPREKARRDRERELNADLSNAADLLGAAALGGTSSSELDSLISAQLRTKDDLIKFSDQLIETIIKRHQSKPLYGAFIEHLARELCMPLKDVEVRKVASGLTALSNEKQKEQRDKASGKKKPKAAGKPILGAAKASGKVDTGLYDEALDDFGSRADDFM
ncbi:Eukaryotic translation initiation factor 3 subunit J [Mycena indigotica]|uniref:Eukaryotic translation initiation factor 3 subunit J n=1 Tax=Mycena indigotica TaxID=2126181 RepID=A0A8H6WDG5_9AGAR|nr:Eukaryotic translation initiation factor 3 subunit J [Mycena indigotica]KAF7312481.1 Eukaryotic translation initiation factor 3 subunit J [Mycena indigotica]